MKTETENSKMQTETVIRKMQTETDISKMQTKTDISKMQRETDICKIQTETVSSKKQSETYSNNMQTETDSSKMQTDTDTETDSSRMHFSFEKLQVNESWYTTYKRQASGTEFDFYPSPYPAPFLLPYEMPLSAFQIDPSKKKNLMQEMQEELLKCFLGCEDSMLSSENLILDYVDPLLLNDQNENVQIGRDVLSDELIDIIDTFSTCT